MIDYNTLPQIEEQRDEGLMGSVELNVENERRLAILETDLKHFQQQLTQFRGEIYTMSASITSGFERVNSNIQTLLIAQASSKGEKSGAGFVVHAVYITLSIASAAVGFIVAVRSFAG